MKPFAALMFLLLAAGGCAQRRASVGDVFPAGASAYPWIADGPVWAGTLDEAAPGLGEDAEFWRTQAVEKVWLIGYTHASRPRERLVVRAFALPTRSAAESAFAALRSAAAQDFQAGERGCWLDDGVLVWRGRVVYEVFTQSSSALRPEQAAYLVAYIDKQAHAQAMEDPR